MTGPVNWRQLNESLAITVRSQSQVANAHHGAYDEALTEVDGHQKVNSRRHLDGRHR